jgi:hypothetical protein
MAAVHEKVHERAGEQQQKGQVVHELREVAAMLRDQHEREVRTVLSDDEERGDGEESQ